MVRNSASNLHPIEMPQVVYSSASLHPFSQYLVVGVLLQDPPGLRGHQHTSNTTWGRGEVARADPQEL